LINGVVGFTGGTAEVDVSDIEGLADASEVLVPSSISLADPGPAEGITGFGTKGSIFGLDGTVVEESGGIVIRFGSPDFAGVFPPRSPYPGEAFSVVVALSTTLSSVFPIVPGAGGEKVGDLLVK
jgi:hypothetical protein